jgi:hypothetical protein
VYFERVEQLRDALLARELEPHWQVHEGRDHGWWDYYVPDYIRYYDFALNTP